MKVRAKYKGLWVENLEFYKGCWAYCPDGAATRYSFHDNVQFFINGEWVDFKELNKQKN